jgi:hypothetical protein
LVEEGGNDALLPGWRDSEQAGSDRIGAEAVTSDSVCGDLELVTRPDRRERASKKGPIAVARWSHERKMIRMGRKDIAPSNTQLGPQNRQFFCGLL